MAVTGTKIVTVTFNGTRNANTRKLFQYDYGQSYYFKDLELPEVFEVHFSNKPKDGKAKTMIGQNQYVDIPDEYLTTGLPVYAWIFLHNGSTDGETRYTIQTGVTPKSKLENAEPTPVQQDTITRTIAVLNEAVDKSEQSAEDSEAWAVGQRDGVDVETDDETYHNNSKYYSDLSKGASESAETSATNAHTSELNAHASEQNAYSYMGRSETAATNAEASKNAANQSAISADRSARDASASEVNAAQSAASANEAQRDAMNYSTRAETAERNASASATQAGQSASQASGYADNAQASANAANQSKIDAANSVTQAETFATNAQTSASNAQASATDSANSASEAEGYKDSASASASQANARANIAFSASNAAQQSATNAANSATDAATSASNAEQSATDAANVYEDVQSYGDQTLADFRTIQTDVTNKATNAQNSASQASASATAAQTARTGAETARTGAETAQSAAEQAAQDAEQSAAVSGYMHFYIDENGYLVYEHTDTVEVDFYLEDGDLYIDVDNDINLGHATAYAYAVAGGYQGTEAEFEALLGNVSTDLAEIENISATATQLPEGSSPTATYTDGVISLGIPKGDSGDGMTVENVSGTDPVIVGEENTRYICGQVDTIAITPPQLGVIDVRFLSGSTAPVMTLPQTVLLPSWFDAVNLEANTAYEICITDGVYGMVMTWDL